MLRKTSNTILTFKFWLNSHKNHKNNLLQFMADKYIKKIIHSLYKIYLNIE
jgi:hypothetical protein